MQVLKMGLNNVCMCYWKGGVNGPCHFSVVVMNLLISFGSLRDLIRIHACLITWCM